MSPAESTFPRLKLRGISKSYGVVRALENIDLELRRGEIMALLGENGAGKSTLMKILSGLVTPDKGTITIDGTEISVQSSNKAQNLGIAVVQQEYSSVPNLSVAENVFLGRAASPLIVTRRRLKREAMTYLRMVGLGDINPSSLVEEFSVAERQLIEIARVLARDAEILLFDEPTAALSDREIERVLAVVRGLADQGRSIIYVTHRLPEVFTLSDRITVLRNGASLPAVSTSAVDVNEVVTMMLGRKLTSLFPERGSVQPEVLFDVTNVIGKGLAGPISFQASRGQIVGLTGQMGSGAADALRLLAGLVPTVSGTVRVRNETLQLPGRAKGIRAGVVYCSPDRKRDGIFGGLSVERNLSSPWVRQISTRGRLSRLREHDLAKRAAADFEIDSKRLESPVNTLSGGNQQKVALGKWTGGSPTVLLVDEPTRGVDLGARAEIYQTLRQLCDEGVAIIVASSDTAEILGLCDSVGAFYRGSLVDMRPNEDWTEEDLARLIMHGADSNNLEKSAVL